MIIFKKVSASLIILPLIVISNWGTSAIAQEKKSEQELLLWRVDPKPESIYSVYILGSYHVGKDCQINSNAFDHAFKDAESVVLEVDSMTNSAEVAQQSQQYITKLIRQQGIPASPDDSLKGILDAPTYEMLAEKTAAVKFPLNNFAKLKPWVFIFAYTSFQIGQTEYETECGLDNMIATLAESKQKDTEGLESLDYQLDKFTDLFINMDADEIQDTLIAIAKTKSPDELSQYFDQGVDSLISTIDAGDSQTLASYINDWCDEDLAECESLLFERNRNWIPKIEQLVNRQQDTLVVVGAGHLVGDKSVLQLLKQKGYRVRRFYNSFRLTEEE